MRKLDSDLALRVLSGLAGAGVMGTATHLNVMHAGGYGSGESSLIIAVAVLVTLGMAFAVRTWNGGHKIGAALLALCLLAGEAYWTLTNAQRELSTRAEAEAPLAEAKRKRAAAVKDVADAKQAKKDADKAALDQAALMGCKANCVALLTKAKADAEAEVTKAQNALNALPKERVSDNLGDHIGLSESALDLIMAALKSAATLGGSVGIALAMHPKRKPEPIDVHVTVNVLVDLVEPADRRSKVEFADLYEAYCIACQKAGIPAASLEVFTDHAGVFIQDAKLPVTGRGDKVYLSGVKLIK